MEKVVVAEARKSGYGVVRMREGPHTSHDDMRPRITVDPMILRKEGVTHRGVKSLVTVETWQTAHLYLVNLPAGDEELSLADIEIFPERVKSTARGELGSRRSYHGCCDDCFLGKSQCVEGAE